MFPAPLVVVLDEDHLLLGCGAKEIEGSLQCGDRCGQPSLTVGYRVPVPPDTRFAKRQGAG